jgi:ABC-type multidrug transport system ATPase subunit
MDPTARREAWDIIKEQRKDKIIILTTHYMDEAE